MPRAKSTDYDTCPACGGRRWKGLTIPVCDNCRKGHLDDDWLDLRYRLRRDNASSHVINLLDAVIIADIQEDIADAASPNPIRPSNKRARLEHATR